MTNEILPFHDITKFKEWIRVYLWSIFLNKNSRFDFNLTLEDFLKIKIKDLEIRRK